MDWVWPFLLVPIILVVNVVLVTALVAPFRLVEWLRQARQRERVSMDELSVRRSTRIQ